MAITGNGELGFDSGEGAWETATTTKVGSRRVNGPMVTPNWGSEEKYQLYLALLCEDCNGRYVNESMSINWRTSLVPAPAVIPAPIAYINAAAVKKLVVGLRVSPCWLAFLVQWPMVAGSGSDKTSSTKGCALIARNGWWWLGSFIGVESDFAYTWCKSHVGRCHCEQTSAFKAGLSQNVRAWNDKGSNEAVFFVGFYTDNV
jgi:hypothetical protein